MKKQVKKLLTSVMVLFLLLFAGFNTYCQDEIDIEIEIQVSPSTLNLNNSGQWVTVHTNIAYGSVLAASVKLDGVAISWSKFDNQGNFVAKFVIGDIKDLCIENDWLGPHELTLTGVTKGDETFSGTYEINIINIIPVGKS